MSAEGGHLGWRSESLDTILKIDHLRTIHAMFALNWLTGADIVFYADRKSKMAATAIHRLTLDPMGKCSNAFFSETTNIIKAKLYLNVHWMVLYKLGFLFRYEIQNGGYGSARFNIGPYGKNVSKRFFSSDRHKKTENL
jgi:hypothetical protein